MNTSDERNILARRVIGAVTAMGFVMAPFADADAAIEKTNGDKFLNGQNTAHIYADAVLGQEVALNTFKEFNVNAGQIANLYFKEDGGNVWAHNLVNVVGSRIDVNGTVNAIKNNDIGGNLFFLSKDGMAVGAGGVINAGSLTVMTPTSEYFVKAGLATWGDGASEDIANGAINLINYFGAGVDNVEVDAFKNAFLATNWQEIKSMNVPLNKMGTITVNGKINTTDGIHLKAAHIEIDKNATASQTGAAVLQSGITDFSSLVNTNAINDYEKNVQLTQSASGDIVLEAVAQTANMKDDTFSALGKNVEGYNVVKADVTVGTGAQIIASGDVSITAEASNGVGQSGLFGADLSGLSADALIGNLAKTIAEVTVDGTVTANVVEGMKDDDGKAVGGNVNIHAGAENVYVAGSLSNLTDFAVGMVTEMIPIDSDASIVIMESQANVMIGENAEITANSARMDDFEAEDGWEIGDIELTEKEESRNYALNISASTEMEASAGAGAAARKLHQHRPTLDPSSDPGQFIPNAGVAYLDVKNEANVTVAGKVTSKGDTNIGAEASLEAEAVAAADAPPRMTNEDVNNFANAAVVIAEIENSANVVVTGQEKTAEGLMNIAAATETQLSTQAMVNAGETSIANTAINITDVATDAKVTVDAAVRGADVDIAAENEIDNEFVANNALGLSKMAAKFASSTSTAMGGLLGHTRSRVGTPHGIEKMGEFITIGASVGILDEVNRSNVTVTENANITAQNTNGVLGDMNIHANTSVGDTHVNVSGATNNYNRNVNQSVLINASFLESDIKSDASVVIEGSDGTSKANLTAANVNIHANSEFVYDRVGGMWADIQELLGYIKEAYAADEEIVNAVDELFQTTKAEEYLTDPTTAEAMEFFGDLNALVDMMNMSTVGTNVQAFESMIALPSALLAYANGANYANFYVSSSTGGKDGSAGGQTAELAVAGSVNINNLENDAQVVIGKDAVIDASDDVDIAATVLQKDVTFNGKVKLIIPKVDSIGGADLAVGGNVGYHTGKANSTVVVAEGAQITANSIDVAAENEVMHIAATFGGGKAGNTGITGMAGYMQGESDSIVVVDDDAKLTAAANRFEEKDFYSDELSELLAKDKADLTEEETKKMVSLLTEAQAAYIKAAAANGAVTVTAGNDTNIQNIIVDKTSGQNTAIGVSFGMVDYSIDNIAAIADNAGASSELAQSVSAKLEDDIEAHLGSDAEDDGEVNANKLTVDASTTGIIDTITVAGVTSGGSNMSGHTSGFGIPAKIGMAGSVSYNVIDGTTGAYAENIDVNIAAADADMPTADGQQVTVGAKDDMMIGAYSGTAALKKSGTTGGSGLSATLAGAVALNESTKTVVSQIKQAQINNAQAVTNTAVKDGATIAAGLALGKESAGGTGAGLAGLGASASVNEIKQTVYATIEDTTIDTTATDATTRLANIAQSNDIQVAGGVNAQYAQANLALGAAVSQMTATNDIQATIRGGAMDQMGDVQNYAVSDLIQVGAAVSAGIISGQSYAGVEGAVVENELTNEVGATIEGATITAGSVDVKAYDGGLEKNKYHDELATDFDIDGTDAMADVNAGSGDVSVVKDNVGDKDAGTAGKEVYRGTSFTADENSGNLIVTSAAGLAINMGSGSVSATAGAAVSTNDIDNSFHAGIAGSNIKTTGTAVAQVGSDTLVIGVAAGAAGSKTAQGAVLTGSASTIDLSNDTTASIENSSVTAEETTVDAKTKSRLINVAGQVSVSKGNVAVGAAVAMNELDNTTGAYVRGVDIVSDTIRVSADNESKNYAIGAGVVASLSQQSGAANGSVAVNKGTNDTEAIVEAYDDNGTEKRNTITGASDIDVVSSDETVLKAIAGNVTVSTGYVGIGGTVAYNEIGNSGKQSNTARLDDADITTDADSEINVNAQDTSDILTVAAGGSVSTATQGGVAQGSVAIAKANKQTEASMSGTNIGTSQTQNANVGVTANSNTNMTTSADVLTVGMGNASAGAGVAVTTSDADTRAIVDGGTHHVKSEHVQASSDNGIMNIGIGVAGTTGQGGSLAGNVAVNNITNDTEAIVKNANINASGTVGVTANSREHLENYAGALSATLGQGYVAVGASVAVNSISGNTTATIEDSNVSAQGTDSGIGSLTGVIVNAESEHELDNIVITGGLAVSSQGGGALSGTVAVNDIAGETSAEVLRTDINQDGTTDGSDVHVLANDTTDISSHIGAAAGAIGTQGAGAIGEAVDSTKLSRSVTAKIAGKNSKNTVNADKINVHAVNSHEVLTSASGLSIAGGIYGSGSIAGTVAVLNIESETNASAENINSNNNGITIKAEQDNEVNLYGNSAAVNVSIGGGSVGVGVLVVNDSSKTQAGLYNSDIAHSADGAEDAVIADSSIDITTEVANATGAISIGGGVSGVVNVNNMNNVVQTDVVGTNINEADSVTAQADNRINTDHSTGSGAVGMATVGATVSVNQIDSASVVNIADSHITADSITADADETRNIEQTAVGATVGGVSVPVNVLVTNIGSALGMEYGTTKVDGDNVGTSVDIGKDIQMADAIVSKQVVDSKMTGGAVGGSQGDNSVLGDLSGLGVGTISTNSGLTNVGAGLTESVKDSSGTSQGVKVNITDNSSLVGYNNVDVQANTTTDTNIGMIGANIDIARIGSTVGVLNIERNSGINITNGAHLEAGNSINVQSSQNGTANLDIYQAGISGIDVNVTYGGIDLSGSNEIVIDDATVSGTGTISADDNTKAEIEVIGAKVSAVLAGALVADASNNSTTEITVTDSDWNAQDGTVTIKANKNNTITTSVTNGAVGFASANATVSLAEDKGSSKIDIESGNSFTADTVNIEAANNPAVKAEVLSIQAQLLGTVGGSVAKANASGIVQTNVASGNHFAADDVNIAANAGAQKGKHTVEAHVTGVNASGFVSGSANVADAKSDIDVIVNVDTTSKNAAGVYDIEHLTISGKNIADLAASAYGVDVSGTYSSGNNVTKTNARFDTTVTVTGAGDNRLGDVTIEAGSSAIVDAEANGYGGSIVDISPLAAYADNDLVTNTTVNIDGTWNTDGAVTVSALNRDELDLMADAVKAAVVGGSGTRMDNDTSHNAQVNISGNIATEGKQTYIAGNVLDHDVEVDASGYGGLNVSAGDMNSDIDVKANVNINGANLNGIGDEGAIEATAYTQGSIYYDNVLKSAGVIPVAIADSEHKIRYANAVNVTGNASLTTAQKYQDITLATYDNSYVDLYGTADTQGGLVGAASAETSSDFGRTNTVNIGRDVNIESMNDVNLYAGAQANGIVSDLFYNIVADAYNKTGLPICTDPDIDNSMTQSNQVTVDGTVGSVRHVNMKANKGLTNVTESARKYTLYGGQSGSGSITSTAAGETSKNESNNNTININGDVKAGIHNGLNLTISGDAIITLPSGDDPDIMEGSIDYSKIVKTVADGQEEWFDIGTIETDQVTITNGLIGRYNEIVGLMEVYDTDSEEYKLYENERARLQQQMIDNGFYAKDVNGKSIILESITIPVISLPDIVISGGNVTMDSDSYNVSGKLAAQGADELTVNSSSNLYLKVNDLVIGDVGGNIYHNDILVKDTDNITSVAGQSEPSVNVSVTGGSNAISKADIGVFGDVINSTGSVVISNANNDISVSGESRLSARNITLKADNGSVTQNSEGLLMVGGDPITKYQFSDDVAKKIQAYISQRLQDGRSLPRFDNYDEYKEWLVETVGIDESKLKYTIDESAGIVAGENVYLSGLNVNIDGLVQSGYQNYSVVLGEEANTRIEAIKQEWSGNAIDDSLIIGNDAYCVNAIGNSKTQQRGGAVYNSESGVYDYEVKIYYNPSTNTLLTEELTPGGGNIYITGAISSTGNGRIRAMDGAASVKIDTLAVTVPDHELKVNSVAGKTVNGLISIKDTQTNTLTEFRNGSVSVTPLTDGANTSDRYTGSGSSYTYNPQKDLTLSWTGGMTGSQKIETKEYREKFVFWGLLDYDKTDEFVKNVTEKGGEIKSTSTSTIAGSDTLAQGVVIGVKENKPEYSITGSYEEDENDVSYSPITTHKEYSNTPLGETFGYGYCKYTWRETTGTSTTSTYTIQADKAIDVGFMTSGDGTINVKGTGNIILAGNISNAEIIVNDNIQTRSAANGVRANNDNNAENKKIGIGSVNIFSQNGAVSGTGVIRSDKFVIDAYDGIDIQHSAIGDNAVTNINTVKGNINILSEKGKLSFDGTLSVADNPSRGNGTIGTDTPTMGSKEGDFYFKSTGDLDFGDTILVGQRIDLISETGSITANVAPGTELTSNDTMGASVNASAYGDITLTNNNGDMRVGHIESTTGDVTLTTSGTFVDAVGDATLSDAENKVDRWLELGLIDSVDSASEKTNAANASKAERLDAITDRATAIGFSGYEAAADAYAQDAGMQNAKATYIAAVKAAGGDTDAINAAYAAYEQAQADYFADKGYSQDQINVIVSYAEVANSSAYGWSKNELLYAIQDSVINSEPGQVILVDRANITGNNIILNAQGGIGIDAEEYNIDYADISQLENLKVLAEAKAGDLTWTDDSVVVRQQKPLTVDASGTITLASDKNIYIAGVKDTELNISGSISTAEDVKLMSDNGIRMDNGSITAHNLIVYGGNGDVGSSTNMLTTDITGTLDANALGSIYIDQIGQHDLVLQAVAAGENAILQAQKNIVMSTEEGKDTGYINAKYASLTSAEGSLGIETDGIRIYNNGVVVDASAENGDIYLQGIGTGDMVLKDVTTTDLTVNSEGALLAGDQDTVSNITTDNDITINTYGNIELNNGTMAVGEDRSINMTTTNGAVIQTTAHQMSADDLTVTAQNGIALGSGAETETPIYNQLHNVTLTNSTGDIILANGASQDLNVTITAENDGNVAIRNYDVGTDNLITTSDIKATGNISIINDELGVTTDGSLSGQNVTVTANDGDVTVQNITASQNANIDVATGNVNAGNITAGEDVTVNVSDGSLQIGKITSGDTVNVTVADTADTDENGNASINGIEAGSDISINTDDGNINVTDNVHSANGDITIEATDGNIDADGNVAAANGNVTIITNEQGHITAGDIIGQEVTVTADSGDITIEGKVDAGQGSADIQTDSGTIHTQDSVEAGNDVTITADNGSIIVDGDVTADNGSITVQTNDTADSDITINGALNTKAQDDAGDITISTQNGNILINDDIIVDGSGLLNIDVQESGDITTPRYDKGETTEKITLQSVNGSVDIHSANGDIDLYEVLANDTASVIADNGNVSLHMIDGNIVVLKTPTEGTKIDVDNATAGEKIQIAGYDITIDRIEQREGAENRLEVEVTAGDPSKPMNNLSLGFGNMANGVEIPNLWTETATITVENGELYMPKMAILEQAFFEANGMTTTVYGIPPIRGNSNSTYWYNVVKHDPAKDLNGWYDKNVQGDWMYLNFAADGKTQYSNGVLLELDNYYYVYDQRFTAVDHMNDRLARTAYEVMSQYSHPNVSYYCRYALYELPRYETAETADSDIVVESI